MWGYGIYGFDMAYAGNTNGTGKYTHTQADRRRVAIEIKSLVSPGGVGYRSRVLLM